MLGEPPPTGGDLHFRVLGIPVRVHPFFWIISLLLILGVEREPAPVVTWVAAVFISILVHELGHALTARHFGWPPRITLTAFGGLASYSPTYHDWRKQILILLAGPGAGFLLAGVVILGFVAAGSGMSILGIRFGGGQPLTNEHMVNLVSYLLYINIFWGLFNLVPLYPLDGGQVLRELLVTFDPNNGIRLTHMIGVGTGALLAVAALVFSGSFILPLGLGYFAYLNYVALKGFGAMGSRPW